MGFRLNVRSCENLNGVHADLLKVVRLAADRMPDGLEFIVTEGLRTLDRQKRLVAAGASRTLNSRHLTGHAVDVAVVIDGEVRWDWPLYPKIAKVMKAAAAEAGVTIEWGGDWPRLRDGPHYQLPFAAYPA